MGTCKEYDQTVNIWAFRLKNKDMLNHPDFSDLPVLLLQVVFAVHIDDDLQLTIIWRDPPLSAITLCTRPTHNVMT